MSKVEEIRLEELVVKDFITQETENISVLDGVAINALSGGVDSSVVTMLGHRALGNRLKTYFIKNGLMRAGECERIVSIFKNLGVAVQVYDAEQEFFDALRGITDPEEKREAITQIFYKEVFGRLVRESGAKSLLQGTNYTDIEETVAGVKRQHNVLEQLGIDTEAQFGYKVIEPLVRLRKPAIREVAKGLYLPEEIYNRKPFPGPALATRVIGEVTPEKIGVVRSATQIVEEILGDSPFGRKAFQYLAILHEDKVTGVRNGKRDFGYQIEVRCWDSEDAKTASPTEVPYFMLRQISERVTKSIPGVVSVTYNITSKPTSTIEAI